MGLAPAGVGDARPCRRRLDADADSGRALPIVRPYADVGDAARGVVEWDRTSSRSALRTGVTGRGIPGM